MFSAPNNLKYKKFHKLKIRYKSVEQSFSCPKFGDIGLIAAGHGKLNAKQIEAGRRVASRFTKKKALLKIDVFPFISLTKKPVSARMGKGKGKPYTWIQPIQRSKVLFEFRQIKREVSSSLITSVMLKIGKKLPFRCKVVKLIY